MKLYDYELSGNCYKVRLLLNILGQSYETQTVDFYPGLEHKSPAFLKLNPLGQLPILEDNGQVISDSAAILTHLARAYDGSNQWYPPEKAADITKWFAFADEITATASAARLHDTLFYDLDVEAARAAAHRLFRQLDEHLWFAEQSGYDWLIAGTQPTLADIACFPYVALSEDGGISRIDYPAIRRWCDRVKRIDGFKPMSGIFPTSKAA